VELTEATAQVAKVELLVQVVKAARRAQAEAVEQVAKMVQVE
jgi:hypothetical protein